MQKIINLLKEDASDKNIIKAQKYIHKHPLAVCMITKGDMEFLKGLGL
jgi:hypothetical protein